MYAVIKSGGKQYRVAVGDVIRVERLLAAPGESVNLDQVLLVGEGADVRIGAPLLKESVTAIVRGHGRGEKLHIFKMRRRKNSPSRIPMLEIPPNHPWRMSSRRGAPPNEAL